MATALFTQESLFGGEDSYINTYNFIASFKVVYAILFSSYLTITTAAKTAAPFDSHFIT